MNVAIRLKGGVRNDYDNAIALSRNLEDIERNPSTDNGDITEESPIEKNLTDQKCPVEHHLKLYVLNYRHKRPHHHARATKARCNGHNCQRPQS